MEYNHLLLKTVFCCMASDGSIAPEEIDYVRDFIQSRQWDKEYNIEEILNSYVVNLNLSRSSFIKGYLEQLKNTSYSTEQILEILGLAICTIEADNNIEYSEVKFFKKIRNCFTISDDAILAKFPDKSDYLLPDVEYEEDEYTDIKIDYISL